MKRGKTIRRFPLRVFRDPLLVINFENVNQNSVELCNYRFTKDVLYSMKKQKRWTLSSLLSKENYDLDENILYSRHQCITNNKLNNTIYMYDSVLDEEYGSSKISGKRFCRSNFNLNNSTNKDRKILDNNPKPILKNEKFIKSRKNHRIISGNQSELNEILYSGIYSHEEINQDKIYIDEFIQMKVFKNNSSKYNRSINQKYKIEKKKKEKNNNKTSGRYSIVNDINDHCNYSEEEYDEELEISDAEKYHRPIYINLQELLSRPNSKEKRKRKHKKKYKISSEIDLPAISSSIVNTDKTNNENNITMFDFCFDILPFIRIDMTYEDFMVEISIVINTYPCWISSTIPLSILVDLDQCCECQEKNYLILKPSSIDDLKGISVKILFNSTTIDTDNTITHDFISIAELLKYLFMRLKPNEAVRYSSKKELLKLDSTIPEMDYIWNTKTFQYEETIYRYHQEWHKSKLNNNIISKTFSKLTEKCNDSKEICEICFIVCSNNEFVIINECQHRFCEICMSTHLIYQIETGMLQLNCPGYMCKTHLDCALILSFINWKCYIKRLSILENAFLQETGISCFQCGTVTITNNVFPNTIRKRINYKCICGNIVCCDCGKKQHWPCTCYEMRNHNRKLKILKDVEIFSEKRETMIIKGISCPNCFFFMEKVEGCNHMTCVCGTEFCWLCGDKANEGNHKSKMFPCLNNKEFVHKTFDLTCDMPDPSNVRSRLYILSLSQRIKSQVTIIQTEFSQIRKIFNSKMFSQKLSFDVKNIDNQFIQIMKTLEFIFVKAYQMDKRKYGKLFNYLKNSGLALMFYQNQIKLIVEETGYYMNHYSQNNRKIKDNCMRIKSLLIDAQKYITKMHRILEY